jgi:hypothetical protein
MKDKLFGNRLVYTKQNGPAIVLEYFTPTRIDLRLITGVEAAFPESEIKIISECSKAELFCIYENVIDSCIETSNGGDWDGLSGIIADILLGLRDALFSRVLDKPTSADEAAVDIMRELIADAVLAQHRAPVKKMDAEDDGSYGFQYKKRIADLEKTINEYGAQRAWFDCDELIAVLNRGKQ